MATKLSPAQKTLRTSLIGRASAAAAIPAHRAWARKKAAYAIFNDLTDLIDHSPAAKRAHSALDCSLDFGDDDIRDALFSVESNLDMERNAR